MSFALDLLNKIEKRIKAELELTKSVITMLNSKEKTLEEFDELENEPESNNQPNTKSVKMKKAKHLEKTVSGLHKEYKQIKLQSK